MPITQEQLDAQEDQLQAAERLQEYAEDGIEQLQQALQEPLE